MTSYLTRIGCCSQCVNDSLNNKKFKKKNWAPAKLRRPPETHQRELRSSYCNMLYHTSA
jgi:hypothetical protein